MQYLLMIYGNEAGMASMTKEGKHMNFLQVHALAIVHERRGMTMTDFASALRITQPSATSFVGRMEKLGWIARKHDAENRKLVRLSVTKKGTGVLRTMIAKRLAVFQKILAFLSQEEQEELARIIEKLRTSLHHVSV